MSNLKSCKIYPNDHGLDHEFLQCDFLVQATPLAKAPRLLFKEAPWTKICEYLQKKLHQISATPEDLDLYSTQIIDLLTKVIERLVLVAKPLVYTKRWWTEDLSGLRKTYARLRNLLRRKRRNREQGLVQLEAQAWNAKGHYFKAMRAQKKKHWEEFLEDTDNIWQAAKYLTPSSISKPSFSLITRLKNSNGNYVY